MANVTGKLDELTARVKTELGIFMANQGVLLGLRDDLDSLKSSKPEVWAALDKTYNSLYSKQTALETRAMDWIKIIADLKTKITSNPDIAAAMSTGAISTAMFSTDFWRLVTSFTNSALPLINDGLVISTQLLIQNGDVALLKQSVEKGVVLSPTAKTIAITSGLAWAYGALGVGIAYLIATRKRGK